MHHDRKNVESKYADQLPPGGKRVKPFSKKTGDWVEMEFDAELTFKGVHWLRAKGGFGDGQKTNWHPREDWIADLPGGNVHVSRRLVGDGGWSDSMSRKNHTMQAAMTEAIDGGVVGLERRIEEMTEKLSQYEESLASLSIAQFVVAS